MSWQTPTLLRVPNTEHPQRPRNERVGVCHDMSGSFFSAWGMRIRVGFFTETTSSLRINPRVRRSPSYVNERQKKLQRRCNIWCIQIGTVKRLTLFQSLQREFQWYTIHYTGIPIHRLKLCQIFRLTVKIKPAIPVYKGKIIKPVKIFVYRWKPYLQLNA